MNRFWSWYEKHLALQTGIAAGLFSLQLAHLYWLTTHVVAFNLTGKSFFNPSPFWQTLLIIIDYTEIPALITTSLVYLNELRKKINPKSLWYLLFINSQWLHIFWITDEFVVGHLVAGEHESVLPMWLAWSAIAIDYLELPVIFDTTRKFFISLGCRLTAKGII